MSKIIVKTEIKNNNEIKKHQSEAIKTENIIKYINDKTVEIFDIENLRLSRKNDEYTNIIDFKQQISKLTYNNFEMELKIKTIDIKQKNKEIVIKYEILDTKDIYEYRIIWR